MACSPSGSVDASTVSSVVGAAPSAMLSAAAASASAGSAHAHCVSTPPSWSVEPLPLSSRGTCTPATAVRYTEKVVVALASEAGEAGEAEEAEDASPPSPRLPPPVLLPSPPFHAARAVGAAWK